MDLRLSEMKRKHQRQMEMRGVEIGNHLAVGPLEVRVRGPARRQRLCGGPELQEIRTVGLKDLRHDQENGRDSDRSHQNVARGRRRGRHARARTVASPLR